MWRAGTRTQFVEMGVPSESGPAPASVEVTVPAQLQVGKFAQARIAEVNGLQHYISKKKKIFLSCVLL